MDLLSLSPLTLLDFFSGLRALCCHGSVMAVGGKDVCDVQSAADYMTKVRTYTGIETPQSGAEVKAPAAAVEGRAGRAAGYDEGSRN